MTLLIFSIDIIIKFINTNNLSIRWLKLTSDENLYAYTISIDDVIKEIKTYYEPYGIRQLLIQGGVNSFMGICALADMKCNSEVDSPCIPRPGNSFFILLKRSV